MSFEGSVLGASRVTCRTASAGARSAAAMLLAMVSRSLLFASRWPARKRASCSLSVNPNPPAPRMTSAEQLCHELIDLVLERGGSDNVTIVVGRALP